MVTSDLDDVALQAQYDKSAETDVIGALLQGGRAVLDALEDAGFDPSDFYMPRHEAVYRRAVELSAAGEPVDVRSVCLSFGRDIDAIGGNGWLLDAWDSRAQPSSAPFYASKVTELAALRRIVSSGMRICQRGLMADPGDHGHVLDFAQNEMQSLVDRADGRGVKDADMGSAIDEVLEMLETGGQPPVATGITELDRLLYGGLRPGTLTTVAARPGVGKTVVGAQIALNIAFSGGNIGYTTLEMTRGDLLTRCISSVGRVDYGRLLKTSSEKLTDAEYRATHVAAEKIRDHGLLISNRSSVNVMEIRSDMRSMIRGAGSCTAWVVDYLGLMAPDDRKVVREQQIAGITRGLKQTALETGIPIVMLAQLNREGEKTGRPPVLTDLRESGAIEQDSDGVLLLHRNAAERPDVLSARLAKNRRGPQGDFEVTFEGSYQRIKDKDWTPHSAVAQQDWRSDR